LVVLFVDGDAASGARQFAFDKSFSTIRWQQEYFQGQSGGFLSYFDATCITPDN